MNNAHSMVCMRRNPQNEDVLRLFVEDLNRPFYIRCGKSPEDRKSQKIRSRGGESSDDVAREVATLSAGWILAQKRRNDFVCHATFARCGCRSLLGWPRWPFQESNGHRVFAKAG